MKNKIRGMIQIYTGNGKGKTTAALGLAFRALGHSRSVFLLQFMKKGKDSGELKAARRFKKLKILQAGRLGWITDRKSVSSEDSQLAQKGLAAAQRAIQSKKYDLIILDELNVAIDLGLLSVQRVKEVLVERPEATEIVITGRGVHPEILKLADLASEVRELKHYYHEGISARAGTEY